MEKNIVPHSFQITIEDRRKQNNHSSFLVWFTGLSGSGKSTIANALEYELHRLGIKTYVLDGDNIRKGLNNNLSFSKEDRTENIRRIAEVANLMIDAGLVVLASFVSPYKKDRENIKSIVKDVNFVEVYINTSIEECERRDVKGLYKKARAGEISNMTGISAPYEEPDDPDLTAETHRFSLDECTEQVIRFLQKKEIIFCV